MGARGSKNIFFIFDTAESKIFLNDLLEIAIQIFLTVAKKNAPWGKLFSFFQGRYQRCPKNLTLEPGCINVKLFL